MNVHTCDQIFTDGEVFWITPLFSKAKFGMALRALTSKVGIPNELQFNGAAKKMGLHNDL